MKRDLIRRNSRILILVLAVALALGSAGRMIWQQSIDNGDRPVSNPGGWVGCDSVLDDGLTRATNGHPSQLGMHDASVITGVAVPRLVHENYEQKWMAALLASSIVTIFVVARRPKRATLFTLGATAVVSLTVIGVVWGLSI